MCVCVCVRARVFVVRELFTSLVFVSVMKF